MAQTLFPAPVTVNPSLETSTIIDGVLSSAISVSKSVVIPIGAHQFVASDRLCAYTSKGVEIGAVTPNVPVFLNVGSVDYGITVSRVADGSNLVVSALPTSQNWNGLAYGNGVFVAVASTTGTAFASSLDGNTWTARTSPLSTSYSGVVWNQKIGLFFAFSQFTSSYVTSPEGITWTTRTGPSVGIAMSSCNDKVILTVNGSATAYYTLNGITWTSMIVPFTTPFNIAYGNGVYILGNSSATATSLGYSLNGITWYQITVPGASFSWAFPLFQNGVFIVVGTSTSPNAISTDNGSTFTLTSSNSFSGYASAGLNACVANDGIFVTAGGTNILTISYDGKTGVKQSVALGGGQAIASAIGRGIIVTLSSATGTIAAYSVPTAPLNPISFGLYAAPVAVS